MVVGYAAFSTNLEIKGTSKVTSNWDIEITNVTEGTPTGSAENTVKPSWDKLWASMEADLYDVGDSMEYDVTIENKGNIDAKLNDILTNVEKENNEAVIITFSGYTKGEILKAGASKQVHVKIEYNPEYEGGETSSEVEINFDYVQNNNETSNPDIQYLVTYDYQTNGGTNADIKEEYYAPGSNINLNNKAYKEGYSFIGWNTISTSKEVLTSLIMGENDITLYAIFKDTTPPVCTLKVKEATVNTVTVEANCEDISGISKYEFLMNSGSYIDNGEKKEYTFNSFDLSTIKLKATDTLTEDELNKGYQIIYDVLNEKYNELETSEENFKDNFLDKTYPVGSIYISTNSTNPSSLFGGTWTAYAQGRTIIGVGSNGEINYETAGLTGGNEKVLLAVANLPSHEHSFTPSGTVSSSFKGDNATLSTTGAHTHTVPFTSTSVSNEFSTAKNAGAIYNGNGFSNRLIITGTGYTMSTASAGAHTHTYMAKGTVTSSFSGTKVNTTNSGGSSSIDVRNPYIVTYMWRRTE